MVVETVQSKIERSYVHVQPAVAIHISRVDAHTRFVTAIFASCQPRNQ